MKQFIYTLCTPQESKFGGAGQQIMTATPGLEKDELDKYTRHAGYLMPDDAEDTVKLTYDMNVLQSLNAQGTFCVSLNATELIDASKVLFSTRYDHPVYTVPGIKAQQRHSEISGTGRTHFCGAYWGNGFHEDGVNSALAVGEAFGVKL